MTVRRGRGRPNTYNWEALFNRDRFEFRAGIDFDVKRSQTTVYHMLKGAARKLGIKVVITELPARDGFLVKVAERAAVA